MKRSACWLAGFAVLAIPDWAAACWPMWCQPIRPVPFYAPPPVCTTPAYPRAYIVPASPPVYLLPQSYVYPAGAATQAIPMPTQAEADTIPKMAVQAGANTGKTGAKEQASPMPPAKTGAGDKNAAPKDPVLGDPKKAPQSGGQAPLSVPKTASTVTPASGDLPPLLLPPEDETKKKTSDGSKKSGVTATPTPAPGDPLVLPKAPTKEPAKEPAAPLTLPGSTIPAVPSAAPADSLLFPSSGSKGVTPAKPDQLPGVSLPPEVPVKPESISRSSPLAAGNKGPGMDVKKFPVVDVRFGGGAYRTVTFYNHTGKELSLTIEGRAVKLPAKSYIETKLAPAFTWSRGDSPAVQEKVPAGAAGLDVVFRE